MLFALEEAFLFMKHKKILCALSIFAIAPLVQLGGAAAFTAPTTPTSASIAQSPPTGSAVGAAAALVASPVVTNTLLYLPLVTRAPVKTIFGIGMNNLDAAHNLPQSLDVGISWTRTPGLNWSKVEPSEGARNWNDPDVVTLENDLKTAAQNNIDVVLIVQTTPIWAQKYAGSFCGPIKQDKLDAFANFVHDAVARYSAPPYNVKYWEIWNEPDKEHAVSTETFGCWGEPSDAYFGGGYYGEMLKTVYPKAKAANPQAQILVGGLLLDCSPINCPADKITGDRNARFFFEGIMRTVNGAFDGVSFHGYDYFDQLNQYAVAKWGAAWNTTGPVGIVKARSLKATMSAYGQTGKFLINTETALVIDSCTKATPDREATKANYIPQSYTSALAEGLRANIWYDANGWLCSGPFNPAYPNAAKAFKFARQQLTEAVFVRQVTSYPGLKAFEFTRSGKTVWVAWALDGASHSVTLPSTPTAVFSAVGTSIAPATTLTIDVNVVYLEF